MRDTGGDSSLALRAATPLVETLVAGRPGHTATAIGDLSMAGRYIPSGPHGESVAGDFFDVFRLHPSRLLIAVGDVAGHGVGAFARMTWLRAATRAFSLAETSPGEVLRQLDRIQSRFEPEDIATLWVAMYNPQSGLLSYASAGHLPPVLAHPGGTAVLLEEAGAPPLGTGAVAQHVAEHEIRWPAGAVLVGFSDGLIERPGADLDDQLAALRGVVELVNRQHGDDESPDALVDLILGAMVPDPDRARDDVCIMALRRA